MKIFSASQIRRADAYTIKHEPISSVDLMERAAYAITEWIKKHFQKSTNMLLFAGPGNNGGDVWAVARLLVANGYENINLFYLSNSGKLSFDSEINKQRLQEQNKVLIKEILTAKDFPQINKDCVVLEGLFGSGLTRPLTGIAAELVTYINSNSKNKVISVDIPSGLFCDGAGIDISKPIIKANFTLSFQFPKFSFFLKESEDFIGKYYVLDIGLHPEFILNEDTDFYFLTEEFISKKVKPKSKFSHKGTNGHGLLIAGSYGMMGAAILSAKAALRSGLGLLTSHIPRMGYEILQISVPESLICIDESDLYYTGVNKLEKYSAIALGPGIQQKSNTKKAVKELLLHSKCPIVIDADALNIIASEKLLNELPKNAILTPHPKEFGRLFGSCSSHYDCMQMQIEMSKKLSVYIVLKGAHTSISFPDGKLYFNTTGNPGMSTGGSGDVLTGIMLGILAQGYNIPDACLIATFLHGLAADIAVKEKGEYSLIPSDIISFLGKAFLSLQSNSLQ